jgi:hypothetical protein
MKLEGASSGTWPRRRWLQLLTEALACSIVVGLSFVMQAAEYGSLYHPVSSSTVSSVGRLSFRPQNSVLHRAPKRPGEWTDRGAEADRSRPDRSRASLSGLETDAAGKPRFDNPPGPPGAGVRPWPVNFARGRVERPSRRGWRPPDGAVRKDHLERDCASPCRDFAGNFRRCSGSPQTFYGTGITAPHPFWRRANVSLYFLNLNHKNSSFVKGAGRTIRHTIGSRWWKTAGPCDFNYEAIFQFGSFRAMPIRAWAFSEDTGYSPLRRGGSSRARYVATAPSITIGIQMNRHILCSAIFTRFYTGEFFDQSPPNRSVNYVATSISYRF